MRLVRDHLLTEERAWTLFALVAAVVGAAVARRLLMAGWRTATGNPPPINPDDDEVTWRQSLMWGLISGAVIGAMRVGARRGAASAWRRWFERLFQ